MQLKYHQATYKLLTNPIIDTSHIVANFDNHFEPMMKAELKVTSDPESIRRQYETMRNKALDWTHLTLYQRPANFSKRNLDYLDQFEHKYGVKLPESVREWYGLDIAPEVMGATNFTYLSIPEMEPEGDVCYFLRHEYFDQGGESLYFRLDSGEDPPVIASYHGMQTVEYTFSRFIFCHFWDWLARHQFPYWFDVFHIPHPEAPTTLKVPERYFVPLSRLRLHYSEIDSNHAHRFFSPDHRIMADTRIDYPSARRKASQVMTGGQFRATSVEALGELIDTVWDDNAPLFRMSQWQHKATETMLDEKRYGYVRKVLRDHNDWMASNALATALGSPTEQMYPAMEKKVNDLVRDGEVKYMEHENEMLYRLSS